MLAFAGTLALICYVIVNIEFPRLGLVRIGQFDRLLVLARQQMG